jgi:hypothetical protein
MKKTAKEVKKDIWDSLSIEDKLHETMLRKVRHLILKGRGSEALAVGNVIKIIFPKKGEVALYSTLFEALWEKRQYKKALQAYRGGKRPFWHAETVGQYYERRGLIKQAMAEYEYLVNEYFKMGKNFLPLPGGPEELFKLGEWYASRDPKKARKYLKIYLKAEENHQGTYREILHKERAEALLEGLKKRRKEHA